MLEYKILPAGDTALIVEFGENIDRRLSRLVLALDQCLNEAKIQGKIDGVVETVPTFRSLMVYYDPPHYLPRRSFRASMLIKGLSLTSRRGRVWRLPVCYDERLSPDLAG